MPASLSLTQQKIVDHGEGALLVVAGPGSGKTRVLTERVRRLLTEVEGHFRILALTFTNKAANEMIERLSEFPDVRLRAFIGTFHSFCMEVLADRGKPVGIDSMPVVFESYKDRKLVLLQSASTDPQLNRVLRNAVSPKEQANLLSHWLEMISQMKNELTLPEAIEDPIERRVYETYNDGLRASGALDFDDLLLLVYRLFIERPKIADFYRRQYRFICIDEAQDLNEAQYQVLRALCGTEQKNVMMVGDPKQAIFVWNGASPQYMDLFAKDFCATRVQMDENFRSSRAVVEAARLIAPGYEVQGQLPIRGSLALIVGETEEEEARKVLDSVEYYLDNGHRDIEGTLTLDRCALIGRTRYSLTAAEEQLKLRRWDYYKHLSAQHESESDFVQDFELCLRLLANSADRLHLGVLLSRWGAKENPDSSNINETLKRVAVSPNQKAVLSAIDSLNVTERGFSFVDALEYLKKRAIEISNEDERAMILADVNTWEKHWDSYLRAQPGGYHSLPSFLSQVALGATQQPRQGGLALLTVHSAKGLEFDLVIIMGMAEGSFPDYRAEGPSLLEEDRNAFVAITRSKRLLALSYPKTKTMPWGSVRSQKPSRYLGALKLLE